MRDSFLMRLARSPDGPVVIATALAAITIIVLALTENL